MNNHIYGSPGPLVGASSLPKGPQSPVALSTLEAARYVGVSPQTLRTARSVARNGKFQGPPYSRLGRRIVYRVSDLQLWLEQNLVGG
jgi:hypothetical protein